MIANARDLVFELRKRGLVGDTAEVSVADTGPDRPWYIGLLLGAAGWVAGIFVLVFVAMLWKGEGALGAILAGAILLAAAWGLYRVDREGAFVSQLALALSIAGQFLMLFGVGELLLKNMSRNFALVALLALMLQVVLVVVMPNSLHRTMSALFACTAWGLFVRFGLWDHSQGFWDGGGKRIEPSHALAILGWALSWLPVAGVLYLVVRREPRWLARGWQAIVRPAATGLILGLAVTTLVSQPLESFPFQHAGTRGGFSLWPLLSAAAALAALAGAFALGSRGLTGVCVIAALIHLSHFYYAMGTSLLVKSVTMAAIGAALLYGARELRRRS
jgi:hypothetical protein